MKTGNDEKNSAGEMQRDELMAALFANMIAQQTQTAFMFLGRIPHPETGQPVQDLETAEFLINQLEMLDIKTRGNLSRDEENLLKQSLTGLRMAFVEAVDQSTETTPSPGNPPAAPAPQSSAPPSPASSEPAAAAFSSDLGGQEESRKKFSKKY